MDRRLRHRLTALALFGLLTITGCGSSTTPSQSASVLLTQGLQAQLSGDIPTAMHDYQQALQSDPNNKYAHYDLGTIDDQQGNKSQALQEYQAALAIDPAFAEALFNTAVDTAGANPSAAEQLYRKVVAIRPSWASAWLNLGFVLQSEGNIAEARADWNKATSLDATLASRLPSPLPEAASPSALPVHSP